MLPELLFDMIGPNGDPLCKLVISFRCVVLDGVSDGGVLDIEEDNKIFLALLYKVLKLLIKGANESVVGLESGVVA